jgi:hypothetical protein
MPALAIQMSSSRNKIKKHFLPFSAALENVTDVYSLSKQEMSELLIKFFYILTSIESSA